MEGKRPSLRKIVSGGRTLLGFAGGDFLLNWPTGNQEIAQKLPLISSKKKKEVIESYQGEPFVPPR